MPYKLETTPNGYYVINTRTGERHSKYPLAYDTAVRQLRALYMVANDV